MRWSRGSPKAAVLPVPVWARATTSPLVSSSRWGITFSCTGIGFSKPSSSMARRRSSLTPSCSNEFILEWLFHKGTTIGRDNRYYQLTIIYKNQKRNKTLCLKSETLPCRSMGAPPSLTCKLFHWEILFLVFVTSYRTEEFFVAGVLGECRVHGDFVCGHHPEIVGVEPSLACRERAGECVHPSASGGVGL